MGLVLIAALVIAIASGSNTNELNTTAVSSTNTTPIANAGPLTNFAARSFKEIQPETRLAASDRDITTFSIRQSEQYAMVSTNTYAVNFSTSNALPSQEIHEAVAELAKVNTEVVISDNPSLQMASRDIQWEIRVEDVRLDKALRRWAHEAGYTLRWDADRYVLISASSIFTGSFERAVEKVLDTPGIKFSEYPLEACVYANEPPLIRITRMGDQTDICK